MREGPSGHSGFQFIARSDDVDDGILRTVERLTVYEKPRDLGPDADLSSYPVNLIYSQLGSSGGAVIARVSYLGFDYSNRPGNYFAHALIVDDLSHDLVHAAPALMWDAPIWTDRPGSSSELPVLSGPLPGGTNSAESIDDALGSSPNAKETLARMVTAVEEALGDGPRVVLVGASSLMVWQWIAALSYVVGPVIAPRMSFCTYAGNPLMASAHVVGTISEARSLAPSAGNFAVIDLLADHSDEGESSPLAALMADAGVKAVDEAWKIAVRLGGGSADALSAWYPSLACALMAVGHELSDEDLGIAIDWLASVRSNLAYHYPIAEAVSRQRVGSLSAARQSQLIDLASDLAIGQGEGAAQAAEVEKAIVRDSLNRLAADLPAEITRLRTRPGIEAAKLECASRLPRLRIKPQLKLLGWAGQAGTLPGNDVEHSIGCQAANAILLDQVGVADVKYVAQLSPDLRAGIVDFIASLPEQASAKLLDATAVDVLKLSDFRDNVRLGERWIAAWVRVAGAAPVDHFLAICDLRGYAGQSPLADPSLLDRFWPDHPPSPSDVRAITEALPPAELEIRPLSDMLAVTMQDATALEADFDSWVAVATAVARWPAELHRLYALEFTITVSRCSTQIRRAIANSVRPETALRALSTEYQHATGRAADTLLLARYLEVEVFMFLFYRRRSPEPISVLSTPLLVRIISMATYSLRVDPHDLNLVATLFLAANSLRQANRKIHASHIDSLLDSQLDKWDKRELATIDRTVRKLAQLPTQSFQAWTRAVRREQSRHSRTVPAQSVAKWRVQRPKRPPSKLLTLLRRLWAALRRRRRRQW